MAITKEILDELLKDHQKPEDLLGQSGLLQQLSKALIERVLDGEMTHHLGYEKRSPEGKNSGNSRNGKSRKTLKGKQGEIPIEVPRDRNGKFDPQFVKKRQTRFEGIRRQDHLALCGWDDRQRNPRTSGGDLRRGGLAGVDLDSH